MELDNPISWGTVSIVFFSVVAIYWLYCLFSRLISKAGDKREQEIYKKLVIYIAPADYPEKGGSADKYEATVTIDVYNKGEVGNFEVVPGSVQKKLT